ncbi:MAG TPA: hypothetical protein PK879_12205 [Opitutaceae bacterium]|nr:hypothetical protein [Opitutaceae bacterium]HPG17350.1 hypothetical protein [Opitutaceae bacterium]HPO01466.1 hypothetical protein [Opitutaceae bacterium]
MKKPSSTRQVKVNEKLPSELLDAATFLYLREIGEPGNNTLRLVIEEAVAGPETTSAPNEMPTELREILHASRPIISDASCFSYEITWRSYISYAVRNESFVTVDKEEKYEGRFLRHYSTSKFLDFVAKGTLADSKYPGPFAHWEIITLDHVIDVVSVDAPHVCRFKKPNQ